MKRIGKDETSREPKKFLIPKRANPDMGIPEQGPLIKRLTQMSCVELASYNIDGDVNTLSLYTLTSYYLGAIYKYLNVMFEKFQTDTLSIGNLIDFSLSIRYSDDAEKIGNITVIAKLGEDAEKIVNNVGQYLNPPMVKREALRPETPDEMQDVMSIQGALGKIMTSYEMILRPDDMDLYTCFLVMIKNAIILTYLDTVKNGTSMIVFDEYLSISGLVKDGKVRIGYIVGPEGRRSDKSDGMTERE